MKIQKITACIWMLLLFTSQTWAGTACDHVDLAWISSQAIMPPDARIVSQEDRTGICEVIIALNGELLPFYAGQDFIIFGQMFRKQKDLTHDTMTALSDLTEKERQEAEKKDALAAQQRKLFFKKNISALSSLVSVSFSPNTPTGEIYVITDPNCSHCKTLLSELEILAFEAKLALKIIIYPLLGPESEKLAAHSICNDYSYEQYVKMTGEEPLITCKAADEKIKKTRAMFHSAGIGFVPVVVASDGSWVVEGNKIRDIRTHLNLCVDDQGTLPGEACLQGGVEENN